MIAHVARIASDPCVSSVDAQALAREARRKAVAARQQGDHETAVAEFARARQSAPDDQDLLIGSAQALAATGALEAATTAFEDALTREPHSLPALRGLADICRRRGDRAGALVYLERVVAIEPDNLWSLADRAAEWREMGALDQAEQAYREIAARAPGFFQAHRGLGHVARRRADHAQALAHFETALDLAPTEIWLLHEVATELRDLGRLEESAEASRRCLAINARFVQAHKNLAQIAGLRHEHDRRRQHLQTVVDLQPKDVSALLALAQACRDDRDVEEARAHYEAAALIEPSCVAAWRGQGLIARQAGTQDLALSHLLRAYALDSKDKWSLLELGIQQRLLQRPAEAASALADALRIDPHFHPARLHTARIAADCGRRDEALAAARLVLAAETADVALRADAACLLRDLDAHAEAEAAFRDLLREAPDHGPSLRGLAHLLRRQERHAEAVAALETLITHEGPQDGSIADLAAALCALGQRQEALERLYGHLATHGAAPRCLLAYAQSMADTLDRAARFALMQQAAATGDPEAMCALAREHLQIGQISTALRYVTSALAAQPNHLSALLGLGFVARASDTPEAALGHFRRAAALHPQSEPAQIELARALQQADAAAEALALLETARADRPQSLALALEIGLHHRRAGDHEIAHGHFLALCPDYPCYAQPEFEAAASALQIGRLDEALPRLLALVKRHPAHVPSIELLGHVALQLNDPDLALSFYERCIEVAPHIAGPSLHKARCLARLGRRAEALACLEALGARHGPLPAIALTQSALHREAGALAHARQILMRSLLLHPRHLPTWATLAQQSIELGDLDFVAELLEHAPPAGAQERWHLFFVRGALAMAGWDVREAHRCFAEAARLHGSPHWDHEWAARAALLMADVEAADHHLQQSTATNSAHLLQHAGQPRSSQTFIGQLLDEYRLNATACERLRQILSGAGRITDLAQAVREDPDFTPAAIAYVLALQLAGMPDRPMLDSAPAIPKTIVQFRHDALPDDLSDYGRSWQRFNGDHVCHVVCDTQAQIFLAQHFTERVLEAYLAAGEPARKADLFRLAHLSFHGGIFADIDSVCTAPVADLVPQGASLVLYQDDTGTLGTDFMAAAPRHPVVCEALRHAVNALLRGDGDIHFLSTGPGLLTRSLATWLVASEGCADGLVLHRKPSMLSCMAFQCTASHRRVSSEEIFGPGTSDVKARLRRVAESFHGRDHR